MASDLTHFELAEMLRCSVGLRRATRDATTMESAARAACRFLYDELRDRAGRPQCALVRCYKTHAYGRLTPELQQFARGTLRSPDARIASELKCLTLLATVGAEPEWNDRRQSKGHQAIALPTPAMVEQAPMIAQLIKAFGVGLADLLHPHGDVVRNLEGRTYGVFYVDEAKDSPYIPAQAFVATHGVRSVIGFGGELPSSDLFAVIIFANVRIAEASADRFRNLALDLKSRFFTFGPNEVFDAVPHAAAPIASSAASDRLR
ncbi:MAG TPA: hypothetical protein VJ867_10020 [Gemmatimonadaceae bacterium]|nr:hypothetical protein [Gemmatimonadaceae bacterium]